MTRTSRFMFTRQRSFGWWSRGLRLPHALEHRAETRRAIDDLSASRRLGRSGVRLAQLADRTASPLRSQAVESRLRDRRTRVAKMPAITGTVRHCGAPNTVKLWIFPNYWSLMLRNGGPGCGLTT